MAGIGTFLHRLEKLLALFREVLPGYGDPPEHGPTLRVFRFRSHVPALSGLPVILHDPLFHGILPDEIAAANLMLENDPHVARSVIFL